MKSRAEGRFATVDKLLSPQTTGPLDEDEQEAVLENFEDVALQEQRTWRVVFGCGAACISAFFFYAAWWQAMEPFMAQYTGELRTVTSGGGVFSVLLIQALSLVMCATAMLLRLPKPGERERSCMPPSTAQQQLLWLAAAGTGFGGAYWGRAMWSSVQQYGYKLGSRWELSWLPAGPMAYVLVCIYVTQTLMQTGKQLAELKGYRYRHKEL